MRQKLTPEARLRRLVSRSLRPLQARGRRTLLRWVDSFALLRPATPDPKRLLVVRLDNIGDFVVWLDAGRALVEHYRAEGRHVTLLGNAVWTGFAADLAVFDDVLSLDLRAFKYDLGYRRRLLLRLRRAGFGCVIQPTMNRVPEMGDAVVRACGAAERIGIGLPRDARGPANHGHREDLYTRLVPADPGATGEMQANASLVRELTGKEYRAKVADLHSSVDGICLGDLADDLPSAPYVVLFPGASAPGRQWPQENFAALAQRCVEEMACAVVLCGGPGDVQVAEAAAAVAGPGVTSLAGRTSLQQLTAVIAKAELLVSNETSAVHIAAAVGVPSVCIAGGGHFGRFVPYTAESTGERPAPIVAARRMECFGCNWVCTFHPPKGKPMPCIEGISVDAVWALTAPLFGRQLQEVEA